MSRLCTQAWLIQAKGRTHCIRNKNKAQLPALCACCASVPGHPSAEVNFACQNNSLFLCLQLWPWWPSGVLFLTIWELIQNNSIWKRFLEALSPEGDASLCIIAVALEYWAASALGLKIHSSPELSQQHRKKRALPSTMATKQFHAWPK
jgi:hypothetical protein